MASFWSVVSSAKNCGHLRRMHIFPFFINKNRLLRVFGYSNHIREKKKIFICFLAVSRESFFFINCQIPVSLFNRLNEENTISKLTCTSTQLLARLLQPR